jgi:beta-glucosidase
MRAFDLTLVVAVALAGSGCAPRAVTELPVPREDPEWARLHALYRARASTGSVNLLFLGDSIIQGWDDTEAWQEHFAARPAAHFGIGGDGTQHLLYRIEHGEIGRLRPEAVVLLIGTNNLAQNDRPRDVAAGVGRVVDAVRESLPDARILLLGLLPRGAVPSARTEFQPPDPRVAATNDLIRRLADGRRVVFLDIGPAFLDAEGRIPAPLMPDFVHPSALGYERMAEALEPALAELGRTPMSGR